MGAWKAVSGDGFDAWALGEDWTAVDDTLTLETPHKEKADANRLTAAAVVGTLCKRHQKVRTRLVVSAEGPFWVQASFNKQWASGPDKSPEVYGLPKQYQGGQYVEVLADSKPGEYRPITDCDYVIPSVYLWQEDGLKITVHSITTEVAYDATQDLWQPVVSDDFPAGWEYGSAFELSVDGLTVGGHYDEATTENQLALTRDYNLDVGDTVRVRVSLKSTGPGALRLGWLRWTDAGIPLSTIWQEGWTRFEEGSREFVFDPIITSAPITRPVLYVANEHTEADETAGTEAVAGYTLIRNVVAERKITESQAVWERWDEGDLINDWTWGESWTVSATELYVQEPTDVPWSTHALTSRATFPAGIAQRVKLSVTSDVPYAVRPAWVTDSATVWPEDWVTKEAGTSTFTLPYYVPSRAGQWVLYFAPEALNATGDWGTVTVTAASVHRQVLKRLPVANSPGVEDLLGTATALPSSFPFTTWSHHTGSDWSGSSGVYTWGPGTESASTALRTRLYGQTMTDVVSYRGESVQVRFVFTTDAEVKLKVGYYCYTNLSTFTYYPVEHAEPLSFPAGTHEVLSPPLVIPDDAKGLRPYFGVYEATEATITLTAEGSKCVRFLPEVPRYTERGELQLRLSAYEPLGRRIGQLPDVLSMTITQPRNDASTLSLKYAPGGVRSELFRREIELGVEYSYDGVSWDEAPGCRFFTQSIDHDALEDGSASIDFSGISVAELLDEVILWEVPAESQDSEGKWNFLSRNAGTILRTVWDAAVARGWGDGLTLNCTPSSDSAGQTWETITTLAFDRTITLRSVLDSLTDIGMIDWCWTGRVLNVWNADTVTARDLSSRVLWPLASGATKAPESKSWAQLCTDVLVKGEGDNVWTFHNDESPLTRRVEKVVSAGGVELESTARQVAETTLQQGATIAEEVKREWHAAEFKWAPFLDYSVGDWVGVQRADGVDKLQVVQTSITFDSKGVSGHTTFGTVLDDLLSRLAKKQKGIVGAASISGNTLRPSDTAPKRYPKAPEGLVGRTTTYSMGNGALRALAELSWGAVAVDTRGNAMDGIEYELLVQEAENPANRIYPMGDGTTGAVEGLSMITYHFYVRAVATNDGTVSEWSEGITMTPEEETTPPPAPSVPTLDGSLAVLRVYWDSKDEDGSPMPSDFDHLEVGVRPSSGTYTVVAQTYSPTETELRVPGLDYGSWEVALRAVDQFGNVSDWGEYATVTLETTVSADEIKEQLDLMLPEITEASAIYQRAAALVAGGDVKWGPYPPDEGEPGVTFWIAPDGKLWLMKSKAEGV